MIGLALRCEICEADGVTPNKKLLDRMEAMGMAGDIEVDGRRCGLILDALGRTRIEQKRILFLTVPALGAQ